MSKLDFPTILILAVCIVAITFLGFKLYEVMTDDGEATETEQPSIIDEEEPTDDTEEDTYRYDIDEPDSTAGAITDEEAEPTAADDEISYTPEEEEPLEDEVPDDFSTERAGKYMVIAGAFSIKQNADNYAQTMQNMGYPNAESRLFNRGKLAVVLVDRFEDKGEAKRLVKELNDKGIEAYLQTKRRARE